MCPTAATIVISRVNYRWPIQSKFSNDNDYSHEIDARDLNEFEVFKLAVAGTSLIVKIAIDFDDSGDFEKRKKK
jgi:hypothetical protein